MHLFMSYCTTFFKFNNTSKSLSHFVRSKIKCNISVIIMLDNIVNVLELGEWINDNSLLFYKADFIILYSNIKNKIELGLAVLRKANFASARAQLHLSEPRTLTRDSVKSWRVPTLVCVLRRDSSRGPTKKLDGSISGVSNTLNWIARLGNNLTEQPRELPSDPKTFNRKPRSVFHTGFFCGWCLQ